MRHTRRLPTVLALLCGLALGLTAGCEPALDVGGGGGAVPPGISNVTCFQDSDCVPTTCCGDAPAVTHVSERESCAGVRCGGCPSTCAAGSCSPSTLQCGTCIPVCRNSRCAAACS